MLRTITTLALLTCAACDSDTVKRNNGSDASANNPGAGAQDLTTKVKPVPPHAGPPGPAPQSVDAGLGGTVQSGSGSGSGATP
jgi:hypothetical protein